MEETRGLIRRRGLIACGLVMLPYSSAVMAAAEKSMPLSQAINFTGKVRANSQRLSKAYVQSSLGVLPDRARDIQAASRQLMTSCLNDLGGSSLTSESRRLLQSLDKEAQGLMGIAAVPKKDALEVARTADSVAEGADKLIKSFETQSQQGNARIVNIAGRQRLLSQRAARAYFLLAAGHDAPAVRTQLTNARTEFTQALATLQAAAISTPTIRNELELARSQWLFYENALNRAANPESLQTVATTSERVFEVMDNLAALYDAALRDLL